MTLEDLYFLITLGGQTLQSCCQSTWLAVVVSLLCGSVLLSYRVIAKHWQEQEAGAEGEAAAAFKRLRNIFVYCAWCGYGFFLVKLVIPAWLPYLVFLLILNKWSWSYALNANNFRLIYEPTRKVKAVENLLSNTTIDDSIRMQLIREAMSTETESM